MLTRIGAPRDADICEVAIATASFPAPFYSGLEFNAPARGTWNIVHTGMLIPESHHIYACAQGCLRGVVLTAAEMCEMDRFSWISVTEEDMYNGKMESNIVDGVAHIVEGLDPKPRAVMLAISCIHLFAGIDFPYIIETLSERFPDIGFVDGYMHPTMRKGGLNPDQTMRRQLYRLLEQRERNPKQINIIGNDFATSESSELVGMLEDAGYHICDITKCRTFDEYLDLARAALDITTLPAAGPAASDLEERLGIPHIALPISYDFGEIADGYTRLAEKLGFELPNLALDARDAADALEYAYGMVRDVPIEIDYTATPRPLSLAHLLIEHGFNVRRIYLDEISGLERGDFDWLRIHAPELRLASTLHPKMRFEATDEATSREVLAIGQKAAWFANTRTFVDIVAGGGLYGYDGIRQLCGLIAEAWMKDKDTRTVISHKGWGCKSCL